MARQIPLLGFLAGMLLISTASTAAGGISISIGASWGTGHRVVGPPCRPAPRMHGRPHGPRRFGPGHFWHRCHGYRVRTLPLETRTLCPPTVVVRPSRPPQRDGVTVWITHSNGLRSEINLTRRGSGFVGPRREYYHTLPTQRQLRAVYGF